MQTTHIRPAAADARIPYSQAVVHGDTVYVAGQLGMADGDFVGEDITSQTRQAIRNLESVLLEAGSDLSHLVRTFVYLADGDDYAAMNDVWRELIPHPFPTRTTVGVRLHGVAKIELEAFAIRAEG